MKFRKSGQVLLAAAVSLGVGLGITSCGQSNTVDFLYVTANKNNPGQIAVYYVDQLSGAISQIKDSPYSSGGRNPVAAVTSPNGKNLYVINKDDNTIIQFGIGTDAKLYQAHTYNTPGSEPVALALACTAPSGSTTSTTCTNAGTYLYVVDYFQPHSPAYNETNNIGPGALVAYPINTDGSLGTPVANGSLSYFPVQYFPSAVNVTNNGSHVYVVNTNTEISVTGGTTDTSKVNPSISGGTISAFSVGSDGSLTAIADPDKGNNYFTAGTAPMGIASDPTSRFLYVTDYLQNQVLAYTILTSGVLEAVNSGPFPTTGTAPVGVVVDPRGKYVYVSNYRSGTISEYSINQGSGAPSASASSSISSGGFGPTCIIVDPALARYVFTANFIDNSTSSSKLDPNTGALSTSQNSPYPTANQPTCVAAVSHGNHASQNVSATAQ